MRQYGSAAEGSTGNNTYVCYQTWDRPRRQNCQNEAYCISEGNLTWPGFSRDGEGGSPLPPDEGNLASEITLEHRS